MQLVWLAAVLIGSLVAVLPLVPHIQPTARAAPVSISYFPWVPNDETIGGQGPWTADVSFQNLSDTFCAVAIYVARSGSWPIQPTAQITLKGRESRTVSSESLGVPEPGAPMRLEAQCLMATSVKQVTPDATRAPWSDGARIVSGYTGLARSELIAADASTTSGWFLPIVQTNSDWNTFMRIASFNVNRGLDVRIELYPNGNLLGAAGADLVLTRRIGIGAVWTVNALEALGPDWVGFARITADGDVGVIANRTKASTNMALTNVGVAADGAVAPADHRLAAPLLFNAYNGWNTGINLANVSDVATDVTVQYFVTDGGMVGEETLTIPGRGMEYIYTPGNVPQDGFVGSAMILSDRPLVAAIDEVKYETTEGLSYMASGRAQMDAAVPVVFRENPGDGHHDNSGINVSNMSPDSEQTVTIELVSITGDRLLDVPISLTLPPGGNNFLYLPFVDDLPAGTVASARIQSQNEDGFVAMSNDINYSVTGDGSVAFVASGQDGYYLVPQSVSP